MAAIDVMTYPSDRNKLISEKKEKVMVQQIQVCSTEEIIHFYFNIFITVDCSQLC